MPFFRNSARSGFGAFLRAVRCLSVSNRTARSVNPCYSRKRAGPHCTLPRQQGRPRHRPRARAFFRTMPLKSIYPFRDTVVIVPRWKGLAIKTCFCRCDVAPRTGKDGVLEKSAVLSGLAHLSMHPHQPQQKICYDRNGHGEERQTAKRTTAIATYAPT
jgi:hypothetical protein